MTLQHVIARRRLRRRHPAGTLAGLITASIVTLIGIAAGLEPFVICLRATLSALAVGALVGFGMSVIQLANIESVRKTESKQSS